MLGQEPCYRPARIFEAMICLEQQLDFFYDLIDPLASNFLPVVAGVRHLIDCNCDESACTVEAQCRRDYPVNEECLLWVTARIASKQLGEQLLCLGLLGCRWVNFSGQAVFARILRRTDFAFSRCGPAAFRAILAARLALLRGARCLPSHSNSRRCICPRLSPRQLSRR